ncbi:Ig-like domain-containing protein [Litorilituus sediminis]|uniref:Uncharacterized protein n=1 Tax=Litorilituus sediminis TaxID=718192 RepID=A0A4P6P8F0_9GAMM|nr:Ig-like domain-containing protein [Litorilituus sediminis]QBG35727.1 hypothetical protein EMK97_08385 [Litorilituus sediminis]
MKKLFVVLFSVCLAVLSGCNGHSDSGDSTAPKTVTSIQFSLLDSQGNNTRSFDKSDTITLQAKLLDENNNAVANKSVNFTSTIGTLEVSAKLSNSEGIAVVYLTNDNLTLGAGSANASIGELTGQAIDFEYVNNATPEIPPSISTTMMLNGQLVNQFKADQQVQVISTLKDEQGLGIANQLVTFTADIGTLTTATALTNAQGIANVTLLSENEAIGAGVITSSYIISNSTGGNTAISNALNYQILPADSVVDSDIRLGYFDDNNNFIEGKIALSVADNSISAGGTLGLSVDLVDETGTIITTPIPVTFTSNCVQNGNATIDESVLSINGTANSTFEDISCAGTTGTDDVMLASVAVNGITNTASETITIGGEQLGSIEFVSAEPASIVLQGTGGQNKQETSTLTFRVKSDLGNVLAQQEVFFTLSTTAGGITLSRESGFTNSQGLITTQVAAGSVPTAVRVTAVANMTVAGEEISVKSQSDLLSINTGLPEQRSMTIAASVLNPEAHSYNGETSTITAWLTDNFNNPVPDGTTINFTTEGGLIEPSCQTSNGSCSVEWESAEPRVANHRVTILATALGHETFFDTNGSNTFDDADGSAIINNDECRHDEGYGTFNVASGFGTYPAQASGFLDMSEAWRDDNENCLYEVGEKFIDFDNDKRFDNEDNLFNGPQCQGSKCAQEDKRSIHVRKSLVLIMASSGSIYSLTNDDGSEVYANNSGQPSVDIPDIADGSFQQFTFNFADTGIPSQTMPFGTTVTVEASAGELQGDTTYTVGNNNRQGSASMKFWLINEAGGNADLAIITIKVASPKGLVTSLTTSANLL